MRTVAVMVGTALASFLMLTGPVVAQERKDDAKDVTIFRSVDLIGKEVRNAKGESLGKVEDYVINMKDASIAYAALQYGDTLGFGGKMFAIPPGALKLSDDWKTFSLNVNKEELEKATGFDANKWPTAPDNRWGTNRDEKAPPRADQPRDERGDDAHLRRLTSLIGLTVKDAAGETLGSCQGAGIDLNKNKVNYMVLAYGGVAGVGSKYFAIPCEAVEMKSFDLKSSGKTFVVNAKKADFENSPGFDFKTWPNRPDNRFSKDGRKP